MRRMVSILTAFYFLAAGLFLVVAPWCPRWRVNRFYEVWPVLRAVFLSGSFRSAITLFGALLIANGLLEMSRAKTAPSAGPPPAGPAGTVGPVGLGEGCSSI